ncbi:MAG: 23S rRNA (uracil(1939)-C(5))-methyltransferase RlmD [Bacilli bacterium]|nr:23S rRNA (uracil(1939)-C(5))-methyltransferase RlmD [Bacilli bacterium]
MKTNKTQNYQLKEGELILLTIKRLGINGEGIGFYKRQVVFVEGAIPGEIVEVKIVKATDKYVYGEITKFKAISEERVEPLCPHFNLCGGCQLQHLSYKAQLIEKKNILVEAMERYYQGDLSKIKIYDTIGMDNPWGYRNKSSLPVRHDGEHVVFGMYAANTNKLVYIDSCPIENDIINKVRKDIIVALDKANVSIYNPKTHTGVLRYVVIRAFPSNGDVQVSFIMTTEDPKLIRVLKELKVTSTNYSINNDFKSPEIFGSTVVNVTGPKQIEGKLGNLKFEISPQAFFQLNTTQTITLYDKIKEACGLTGEENVLDCYCGIGSIGLYLAPYAKEVRGIDVNGEGIKNAINFAKINDITNARFYKGNILPHLHDFKKEGFNPDVLVVDPPRKGLELSLINYLQSSNIKKVVYVSCNIATLAKNINHLQKYYSVKYIQPIDMFPNTSHVETVCLLTKK